MKIPNVKRCVSGLMAAMMVLTSCGTSTPVFADELEYPPLQSVIDQLDAEEIVRPSDYIVPVGAEFNVSIDFSNLDIPDPSKVNIYLDDAVNSEGSWFSTDHADTYRTTYHIEPVSGHPVYQISRSIRVKESEKPAPAETESVQTGSNGISEEGSPSEDQSGENPSDEDSQTDENGPGDTEVPSTDSGSDSGTESVITEPQEASDGQEQPEDTENPNHDESSVAEESEVTSGTESSLSLDEEPGQETESGIGSTLTEDVPPTEEDDDKPSILSMIVSGITGLFAKDDAGVPEDELIDEALVGASGAAIDATVNCTTSSFGSVYVNHAYQTSGNSGGDVIIYCGEVDMHFSEGAHTRQNLVGNTLEGHTVTAAEALRVGIMQYYFWNKAGVGNDKARGLTQRAVWAMAVGDEASGVSNTVYLTQAGLLDVYNAAKAYASANASKFELDECYVLAQGSSQKLVYISVSEKPDEGSAKLVKKSSDAAVSGNSSYSLKGAVYGVYSDKDCTKKVKELTTGEDGTSNTVKLSAGTYYVKEITAPKNFRKDESVHTVKVESGKTATVTVTDTPEKTPIHVLKTSENGEGMPVCGTVYTVYSDAECTKEVGTLTVGDDGRTNVLEVLYGTYYVKETKAAEGYMIDTEIYTVECRSAEETEISLSDRAVRGGVKIGKWEAETERREPQGASSLGGTAFAIVNKSENPVLVDGEMYENGATIATVKTDKDGYWESKSEWLPYGSYAVIETTAPEGHENAGTVIDFEIRNDGEVIDLDKGQLMDQVFRGDLELVKAGQNKKERLANVAFLVTSKTTGEAHVLVTDPNGQAGTASSYAAHTQDTNRNDEAYKDGKIDDAKLSHSYGIWFSGEEDVAVIPDDAKGALPYDTYTVQELRCAANEGYELVSYDITVYRNGAVVDCGTVDDDEIPKVEIATQAGNDKAKTPEGSHIALAEEKTELTDRVSYAGLTSGKTYSLKTVLMDRMTGAAVTDRDGNEISLVTELRIHFWNKSGTVEVPVMIDARELEGHTVVFFEYLYDEDGKEIGNHTDINDEDQTIVFPKAETEASDEVTKTNIVLPAEDIRVKDILKYENLLVGKEYLVTGTLMDKKTGEAVLDDNGQPVTTSKRFTAEKKDGEVEMLFEFSGVKLAGTVMVAFEKVSLSGVEIMAHADLSDEGQTVYEPSIGTVASDRETGEKEITAEGVRTICDHVSYEALPKGRYVLAGTLMNKETGGAFVNAEGKELTAEKEFEVTEMSGTVDMEFTVDAEAFAGRSVVVFEKVFPVKEDGTRKETPAAVHEDINDEDQTVSFPEIGTVLLDKDTESHCAKASEKVTHIDTVTFSGLIVGKEYTAKGRLVDKETGEPVLDGGKEVTAEKTFTAETSSGKVEIEFTFNASALEGKSVVAFEDMYREEKLIASHADLSDEDQSIHYPKIGTELKDLGSGTHYTTAVDDAVLVDTVSYSNLIAGRKYNVVGVLMDKETGAQVQADGEAVRAAAEFTPEGPDGTVELSFKVSGPALAGKTVVAFEVLYDDGKEVAAHEDMDDEAQTVYSPGIRTELINNESNSHYAEAENPRNFTDTVYYTNLMPGRSYTVSGTLVDKSTGKNLMIGGSEVTAEKTFTPEEKDGIVEISFEFDCRELTGKSVVAYEFLYRDGIMIAGHADINDEAQTVTIGKKPTPTPTVTPIPPTKVPGKPSTPSTPGTTTRSAPVRTGDTTNIMLPVILLGVSAAVIAALLIRRKKKA